MLLKITIFWKIVTSLFSKLRNEWLGTSYNVFANFIFSHFTKHLKIILFFKKNLFHSTSADTDWCYYLFHLHSKPSGYYYLQPVNLAVILQSNKDWNCRVLDVFIPTAYLVRDVERHTVKQRDDSLRTLDQWTTESRDGNWFTPKSLDRAKNWSQII